MPAGSRYEGTNWLVRSSERNRGRVVRGRIGLPVLRRVVVRSGWRRGGGRSAVRKDAAKFNCFRLYTHVVPGKRPESDVIQSSHDSGAHESGRISVINMNMPVGTPSVHDNSKVMYSLRAPNSSFDPPPLLHTFLNRPVKTVVRLLDYSLGLLRSTPKPDSPPIRIVCISDTHCLTSVHIPDGDLLIHAGDLTNAGTPAELQAQIDWLDSLPHKHKVAIRTSTRAAELPLGQSNKKIRSTGKASTTSSTPP